MKFHLPKKLMLAVLAAMAVGTAEAGYYTIGQIFEVQEGATQEQGTLHLANVQSQSTYAPLAKDGTGTAYITETGTINTAIYVREGTLIVQGSDENSVTLTLKPASTGKDESRSPVSVSGKDSVMVIDKATVKAGVEGSLSVGGADGNGTLTLQNGGEYTGGMSFFVGVTKFGATPNMTSIGNSNSHATTADVGDALLPENRFEGTYYDEEKKWGKGEVNIIKSKLYTGWGGLYLGEGTINVEGEGAVLKTGADLRDVIGYQNNSTAILNIKDSATYEAGGTFYMGYNAENSTSILNIDHATFKGGANKQVWIGKGRYVDEQYVTSGSTSTVNITNGGLFSGGAVYLSYRNDEAEMNIDATSTLQCQDFGVFSNGMLNSQGTIDAANSISIYEGGQIIIDAATAKTNGTIYGEAGGLLTLQNVTNNTAAIINGGLDLFTNFTIELELSSNFASDTLNIVVANNVTDLANVREATLKVDSLLWTADNVQWNVDSNVAYVTGTLTKKESVNVTNQDVVLDNENALGDGPVSSEGTSSITTATGVTVVLPDTIENSGDLTMSGSYDGTNLQEVKTDDTYVCVDGKEGNNGFFREGGEALIVVNNKGEATLTVDGETTVTNKAGEALTLYASGLAAGELQYDTYHIVDANHSASMSEIQSMSKDTTDTIDMKNGTLIADKNATNVQATGGNIAVQTDEAIELGGTLSGTVSVQVSQGEATLSGNNSQTGATVIDGMNSKLIVGSEQALGQSIVYLQNKAALDLSNHAVSNQLIITGCTLSRAGNYKGNMEVSGNLELTDATSANKVTLVKEGSLSGESITTNSLEVADGATGSISSALTINPNGSIILNNGNMLSAGGGLTVGEGFIFILNGKGFQKGTVLVALDGDTNTEKGMARLSYGYGTYELSGSEIILTAVFDQKMADTLTLGNWGMATASRAFVNTVRGQRNNTGCIANGRGTAWVSVLGASHEVADSDIDLKGAAVGADMKVGNRSTLGVALGYTDGEIQPQAMQDVDQTGTYVAVYGEHKLKELSTNSNLSMDWVAAYGQTESEFGAISWEQQSVQVNSRLNWNKQVNERLRVSTFGGLEYFASDADQVQDVTSGSLQNLRGELGVGARYVAWGAPGYAANDGKGGLKQTTPGCEKLVFHGELRYINDLKRNTPAIEMDGLRGRGQNPGHQGMGIEAGATYRFNERWSGSANYGFNAMEDSKEHRVNVGASYSF